MQQLLSRITDFTEIVLVDFEFTSTPGERPGPVCLVARELRSGRTIRLWRDQFGPSTLRDRTRRPVRRLLRQRRARLPSRARLADAGAGPRSLRRVPGPHQRPAHRAGAGLLGALSSFRPRHHGRDREEGNAEARSWRGGPWSSRSAAAILDYCEDDVEALERLLPRHAAADRSAARAAARALHGRGCRDGAQRRADRRRDAWRSCERTGRTFRTI